jgi:hypothetical protein
VADLYSFNIVAGGRPGGRDKRLLDVFYGSRPFDEKEELPNEGAAEPRLRFLVEGGASLQYQCQDTGYVSCFLLPARTENMSPVEDAIIVGFQIDPSQLLQHNLPSTHWKLFSSYMHSTSLDGVPTWIDKFRVFRLRYLKHLIIKKEGQTPRIMKHAGAILRLALTVGLSGFLLIPVNYFMNRHNEPVDVVLVGESVELQSKNLSFEDLLKNIKKEIAEAAEAFSDDKATERNQLSKVNEKLDTIKSIAIEASNKLDLTRSSIAGTEEELPPK